MKDKIKKPIFGQAFHFRKDEDHAPHLNKYEGKPFQIISKARFMWEGVWGIRFADGQEIFGFADEVFPSK